ncbi:prestalk D11 protein-like [Pecten maximus]|uniref:prestalk D11 protein-like n=1 Tax=Pecten maximus TaxID=6579 RepID=UPI0014582AA5|nr:prestalk D11 protein-like [Pecten maximus]
MMLICILIITALSVCGSLAVSPPFPPFPFKYNPGSSDSRCPQMGRFGICAFTCSSGSCGPGRVCCPTACGGTTCKTPRSPPAPPPISSPCPEGVPMPSCTFVPCERETCPNHPQATCVDNYCGGCNAKFFLGHREVTQTCKKLSPVPTGCKNGEPMVKCLVNPCTVKTCHRHPHATCVADYCGGCNAKFFLNGHEVTQTCKNITPSPTTCKNGEPLVNCLVNPCSAQGCPRYPNAKCVADYCGGCNARFFVKSKEVTNFCRGFPLSYLFK